MNLARAEYYKIKYENHIQAKVEKELDTFRQLGKSPKIIKNNIS